LKTILESQATSREDEDTLSKLSLQIQTLQEDIMAAQVVQNRSTALQSSAWELENQNVRQMLAFEKLQLQHEQITTQLRLIKEENRQKDLEITSLKENRRHNEKLQVDLRQRDLEINRQLDEFKSLGEALHDHQAQIQTHLEAQQKAEADIQKFRVSLMQLRVYMLLKT